MQGCSACFPTCKIATEGWVIPEDYILCASRNRWKVFGMNEMQSLPTSYASYYLKAIRQEREEHNAKVIWDAN